jgi:hypothetical protein
MLHHVWSKLLMHKELKEALDKLNVLNDTMLVQKCSAMLQQIAYCSSDQQQGACWACCCCLHEKQQDS